jgi:hypothetical protein
LGGHACVDLGIFALSNFGDDLEFLDVPDSQNMLPVLDFVDFIIIVALFHLLVDIRIKLRLALDLH